MSYRVYRTRCCTSDTLESAEKGGKVFPRQEKRRFRRGCMDDGETNRAHTIFHVVQPTQNEWILWKAWRVCGSPHTWAACRYVTSGLEIKVLGEKPFSASLFASLLNRNSTILPYRYIRRTPVASFSALLYPPPIVDVCDLVIRFPSFLFSPLEWNCSFAFKWIKESKDIWIQSV